MWWQPKARPKRWRLRGRRAQRFFREFHGEDWAPENGPPGARQVAEPLHELVESRFPRTAALLAEGKLDVAARSMREDQARLRVIQRDVTAFPMR